MPTPPGPYPSKVDSSYCSPSSCPVPRRMARSTFSPGMFADLAASMAVRSRGLEFGSPPPMRAAMLISRMIRVKTRPRFASVAPFLCLIVAHFECPDITDPLLFCVTPPRGVIRECIFATCSGFEEKRLLRPKFTRTDLQSPRKTAPVRRLTVNRKPLSTASRLHFHQNSPSLAQPPMLRNGLYPTPGHLLAFDRLPPAGGPKKTGQRPAPRVRSSFAYRAAMALHEKEISCARLL